MPPVNLYKGVQSNSYNFHHLYKILADVFTWLVNVKQKIQFSGVNFWTMNYFSYEALLLSLNYGLKCKNEAQSNLF